MGYKAVIRRYYVLSKPGIIYANVLTAAAGYLYASAWNISFSTIIGLLIGLALVIAGACAVNNYLDQGIDAAMQRTKKRGLVTGDIRSWQALTYSAITTGLGLAVLSLTQNRVTIVLAIIAYVDYVVLYGWGKRNTVHSTLIGCVSGAIPLVAGYTAVAGRIDVTALLLFALMVAWQMVHFYGIALFRFKDYKAAKLPLMPVVYGVKSTQIQALLYLFLFMVVCIGLILHDDIGFIAAGALLIISVVWLVKALRSYKVLDAEQWGRKVFLFSLIVLLTMAAVLSVDPLLV
ncbi:heme o synthase [soil metagenome]